jgi:hypothetical protein
MNHHSWQFTIFPSRIPFCIDHVWSYWSLCFMTFESFWFFTIF